MALRPKHSSKAWMLLCAGALSACEVASITQAPVQRPPEPAPGPSAESVAFSAYYASVEDRLLADGLLRTDGGGPDTPITAASLARNFERIALFDEYTLSGGQFVARETPSVLRRWSAPVRLQAHFGPSTGAIERSRDRAYLASYARRLARVTGHPISVTSGTGNFHVLYLNRDEQLNAEPLLRELVPGIGDADRARNHAAAAVHLLLGLCIFRSPRPVDLCDSDRCHPYGASGAFAPLLRA